MDNSTTPQDDAAMPPASTGSVAGEPVAYQAVDEYGRPYGYAQIVLPFGKWPKSQRVPLYAQPQPTLTDAEREAMKEAADAFEQNNGDPDCERIANALYGLLNRLQIQSAEYTAGISLGGKAKRPQNHLIVPR